MKAIIMLAAASLAGCAMPNWPGGGLYGYGYPAYGYGYPMYGGFPGLGWRGYGWNGYSYGYNAARAEDWRRWQAYQYGLSQGRSGTSEQPAPSLPYGITREADGRYHVPGHGSYTPGQIQHWLRKQRR